MALLEIDFDPVDSITVGVEGTPGSRTFFLEASSGVRECTLLVEKVQLQELAAQLLQVLKASEPGDGEAPAPRTKPGDPPGWYVGTIQLAVDEAAGQCTILLEERTGLGMDADEATAADQEVRSARLVASSGQLRLLAERSLRLVEGGRSICPLCLMPMDPAGHICPASNGHHR